MPGNTSWNGHICPEHNVEGQEKSEEKPLTLDGAIIFEDTFYPPEFEQQKESQMYLLWEDV